jgi:hypothetical protein
MIVMSKVLWYQMIEIKGRIEHRCGLSQPSIQPWFSRPRGAMTGIVGHDEKTTVKKLYPQHHGNTG